MWGRILLVIELLLVIAFFAFIYLAIFVEGNTVQRVVIAIGCLFFTTFFNMIRIILKTGKEEKKKAGK